MLDSLHYTGLNDAARNGSGITLSRSLLPCVEQFTIVCHVIIFNVDFQTTLEDVLVCDLELMALLTFLFLSLSTEHVIFSCLLRVLAVFALNATLIFSLIIIIIIIIIIMDGDR